MNGNNAPAAEQRRRRVLAAASALTLSLGLAAAADAATTGATPAMVPGVGKLANTRDATSGLASGKRQHKPLTTGLASGKRRHGRAATDDWDQTGGKPAGKPHHPATDDWTQ